MLPGQNDFLSYASCQTNCSFLRAYSDNRSKDAGRSAYQPSYCIGLCQQPCSVTDLSTKRRSIPCDFVYIKMPRSCLWDACDRTSLYQDSVHAIKVHVLRGCLSQTLVVLEAMMQGKFVASTSNLEGNTRPRTPLRVTNASITQPGVGLLDLETDSRAILSGQRRWHKILLSAHVRLICKSLQIVAKLCL